MVTQQTVLTTTIVAAEELTAHRLVGFDGKTYKNNGVELGVAEVAAKIGDSVPVNMLGILAVEAGGVISAGQILKSDTEGRVVKGTPPTDGLLPFPTVGVSLDAATAVGEIIRMVRGIC